MADVILETIIPDSYVPQVKAMLDYFAGDSVVISKKHGRNVK